MLNIIKRQIYNDINKHLSAKEISLITGPRQVGKTTLMNSLKEKLEQTGEKTVFLSLDFEADKKFFNSQNNLVKKLTLELGNKKGYVFIDEIQRKENAGLFLKGIYDMNLPYKFIISGSGSVELKEKTHESLAGRKRIFELFPVSFSEFVNFKTNYRYEDKINDFFSINQDTTASLLDDYLNFGGYPRVVIEEELTEKLKVIDEILKSYLEKDIDSLLKVEKLESFNFLLKILSSQTGKLINYSELSNTLNIRLETLKKYLWYIEKTFIAKRVSPFYQNTRKEIVKSPIMYFYDLGLRNYFLDIFGNLTRPEDFGFIFQNFIFLILREKLRWKNATIHFWRTKDKAEVDFIVSLGRTVIPIEVKYKNLDNPVIPRALKSFIKRYNPDKALIINKNFSFQVKFKNTKIIFLPFWRLVADKNIF